MESLLEEENPYEHVYSHGSILLEPDRDIDLGKLTHQLDDDHVVGDGKILALDSHLVEVTPRHVQLYHLLDKQRSGDSSIMEYLEAEYSFTDVHELAYASE